ncbi:hypothetical protein Tco_0618898 [Tanacetum coccineum]
MEQMTSICDMIGQYMQKKEEEKRIAEEQAAKARYWKIPIYYDDDDDEESSIPLRDIIISGLPPESEGIPDNMCDVPFCDNSPPLDISKDQFEDFSNSNDDSTSIDDDSFSIDDIDTTTHAGFSQYDSFIFDLLIHPFPPADRGNFYHEKFVDELAHIISPPEYDCFYFKNKPELGDFTTDVVEDIFYNQTREPRVHVPNVLPTHPNLHQDSDFTLSSDSLGSDLVVSFPSRTRNKIFDPGIFIGVQSKIFLSRDEFSISFIRDPPLPVIDTLLLFSSENENKVVNPGILAAGEEKSPHLSSHRGLKALNEIPMMISGGDIPNLDVPFLHFYPP